MSQFTKKIERYFILYASGGSTAKPRIWLRDAGGYIGQLVFWPNGTTLPKDNLQSSNPVLFYHHEDFQNVIDILAHGGPVFLNCVSGENTLFAGRATGQVHIQFQSAGEAKESIQEGLQVFPGEGSM